MIKSGSARTLYLHDELWNRLLQLVKLGYARNASQLVNRLLADSLEKQMKGYGDEYRALIELLESLGLDIKELSNHQIK